MIKQCFFQFFLHIFLMSLFFFMIESWNWNTSKSLVILCWWDHIIPCSQRWVVSRDGQQQDVTLAMESREKPIQKLQVCELFAKSPRWKHIKKKMNVRFAVIVFYKTPPPPKKNIKWCSFLWIVSLKGQNFLEHFGICWFMWLKATTSAGEASGFPRFEKSSPKKDPEIPGASNGGSPECDARDIRGTGGIVTWINEVVYLEDHPGPWFSG